MKLDYSRVRQFISRLKIRNKSKELVPFHPNPCQHRFLDLLEQMAKKGRPPRVIIDKSRRVGISTICVALLNAQCCGAEAMEARVLAHLGDTSRILLDMAKGMHQSIGLPADWRRSKLLLFDGDEVNCSKMTVQTAKTTGGGRGGGFTSILASEAAYYEKEGSFLALLPTLPRAENFFCFIESTANGRIGVGEDFYTTWRAAVRKESEFEAFFVPWYEDPSCIADPEILKRPTDDENGREEKEIRAKYKLTDEQMAWRRLAYMNEAEGLLAKLHQEFPISWEESFIASDSPTFDKEEIELAEKGVCKAKWGCELHRQPNGRIEMSGRGPFRLWETPKPGHEYFLGADAARGTLHGDFAAAVVWNGTTGHQAAAFQERAGVDEFAEMLDKLGRFFNNAMMTPETSCNLGNTVMQRLLKDYKYPRWYRWQGRDDRLRPGTSNRPSIGFETTARTRHMLTHHFRISLRDGEVVPHDEEFVSQIKLAETSFGMRWDVTFGHDDVLMAGLVGWLARVQFPPRKIIPMGMRVELPEELGTPDKMTDLGPIVEAHRQKVMAKMAPTSSQWREEQVTR
jgi:hypothetical protein